MLDIYICEDNLKQLNYIENKVKNLIAFEELDIQISLASTDPHEIIKKAKQSTNTGLYFLDVDLNCLDMNGFILAQNIRKIEPRCFIVFITSHLELSFYTYQYKLEVLDYIIKDDAEHVKNKIHECILNAYEKHTGGSVNYQTSFTATMPNGRQLSIPYTEILCFEMAPIDHRVILHGSHRLLEFPDKLNSIETRLDNNFMRCHRSIIVNLHKISEVNYTTNEITMCDGSIYPVSIRKRSELKKRLKAL